MNELKYCNIEYTNQYEEHLKLEIFNLEEDTDIYSMRLYIISKDNEREEIFSTWIDSNCGEVSGNQEIYKDDYDNEIYRAYDIFSSLMSNIYNVSEE